MSVLAMSGHVDHGKSTFLKYLTQKDTDRLLEEKKRGMTIDLNFVWLEIQNKTIGIIDVPGHKDYLKNMIAGVFGVEAFIFIVAADDGWMPQSEEHLNILKGLKINQGFAVITKTDLVSRARVEEVKEFVQQKIGGCSVFEFNPKQLELLTSIRKEIEKFSTLKPIAKFSKVYIDRVFSPKGLGAVVTGTLSSGKVSIGDSLMLYPEKREVSVKKIQTYHQDKQEVAASERVALQLSKVSISDLRRGQLLSSNKNIELTKSIEAQIDFSVELKKNIETWFYTGTLKQKCRIIPYKELPNFFRVKFDKAVALNPLESFILRNSSDEKTIGFGVVANTKLVANKHALSVAALKQWQATPEGYLRFQEFLKPKETKVLSNKEVEEQFYLAEKDKFLEPYKSNIEPFKLQKDALVQKMILKKDLMYLSEEHYLSKEAYDVLSEKVKNYISTNGQASTSELREHMGLSRKYVVMILESFDRNRLTYLRDGVRKLLKTFVLLSFLTSSIFAHKKDCVKEVIDYSEQATINALCLHDIIPDTVKVSLFFIYHNADRPQSIVQEHWDNVSHLFIWDGLSRIQINKNTRNLRENIHKILSAHDFKLATMLANKHFKRFFSKVSQLELIQEALFFGYHSALEAYRPEKATSPTSYTISWLIQAMNRYLETHGNLVYTPVGQQEDRALWNRMKRKLKGELGRKPSEDEIYDAFIKHRVTSIQNHRAEKGIFQSYEEIFKKLAKRHRKKEILISNMRDVSRKVKRDKEKNLEGDKDLNLSAIFESFEEIEFVQAVINGEKASWLADIDRKIIKYKLGIFNVSEFPVEVVNKYQIRSREPISNVKIAELLGLNPVQVKWRYANAIAELRLAFNEDL